MGTTTKAILGAAAAVAGYLAVKIFLAGGFAAVMAPSREDVTRLFLTQPNMGHLRVLHDRAPEEFDELLTRIMPSIKSARRDEIFAVAERVGIEIRRRNADFLRRAPQDRIVRIIETSTEVFRALQPEVELCNQVIMRGPGGLGRERATELLPVLEQAATAVFEGMYDGRDGGVATKPATEADYTEVISGWRAKGASDEMIDAVLFPAAAGPELCGAFIGFFDFLASGASPGLKRVRTDIVVLMAKS